MATYSYKNLDVWKRSMDLVVSVYGVAEQLPKSETYALADQLKRAAVSVPSNIAEGQKRASKKETAHFTYVALGSVAELETQLVLVQRLYNIDTLKHQEECVVVAKMLTALAKSLKGIDG